MQIEASVLKVLSFGDFKREEYDANLILDLCSKSYAALALNFACVVELLFLANVIEFTVQS